MNILIVGAEMTPILEHRPERHKPYLLIDDGPIADLDDNPDARHFDILTHTLDPLKGLDRSKTFDDRRAAHLVARRFVSILDAANPEGSETLTRRYSSAALMDALEKCPRRLSDIFPVEPSKKDAYAYDAFLKVKDILRSPVLERVLNGTGNRFSMSGTIIARLDRAVLGDTDAFILGNILMALYAKGTIIVPDFGFYAAAHHSRLIREGRLVAGVSSFEQIGNVKLRNDLMLIERKIPSRCTFYDAKLLAAYEGLRPDPLREENDYDTFIGHAIGAA